MPLDRVKRELVAVRDIEAEAIPILWELLKERDPKSNISHKQMPTPNGHKLHVKIMINRFRVWYLIKVAGEYVGQVQLTRDRPYPSIGHEIGIQIFKRYQGLGIGRWAVMEVARRFPGDFHAHINPENEASKAFFSSLGFTPRQVTYSACILRSSSRK